MNYIRFSDTYDTTLLITELQRVLQEDWPLHFNSRDYNGDWRSISLRSATGKSNDINAHGNILYKDTPVLDMMPYARQIIDSWQCEKEAVRLLSLAPGSEIKPHRDMACGYSDGTFRIHIPIITNPGVLFTLEDETLYLAAGECWYMDFNQTHSIVNRGDSTRVHLIMDCRRNGWTDRLFAAHGYDLTPKQPSYDAATKARIIEELERLGTDVARNIIAGLKAEN